MCGPAITDSLNKAVNDYKKETGDERAGYLELDAADDNTVGSRQHPGKPCHLAASQKITAHLKNVLQ